MSYIELENVNKEYNTNGVITKALNNVSFSIEEGSFNVILGPSGAGKTTLLNLLGGMDYITSGNIYVDKKNLYGLKEKELTLYRRCDVGFVFQFYNLMPNLNALENIELALEIKHDSFDPEEMLKAVGLENRKNHFPSQLSGGEQQRVSIARAIAKNPKLLLCDEPTGALDVETGRQILALLKDLSKKDNKTVIIVTHNQAIKEMADNVIYIKNGSVLKIEKNESPKSAMEIEF